MSDNNQAEAKPAVQKKPQPNIRTSKKSKKGMSFGAVLSIIILLLVMGFFVAVYFDIGGLKQMAAGLLSTDDPVSEEAALQTEEPVPTESELEAVRNQARELEAKEEELTALQTQLEEREQAIALQEEQLSGIESQAEQVEIEAAAKIFEQMDALSAADAISELDTVEEMAKLLVNMDAQNAANIIEQMESDLASEIASAMMSQ